MNYKQLNEKAKAMLILYYGINEPNEQQSVKYILYGRI